MRQREAFPWSSRPSPSWNATPAATSPWRDLEQSWEFFRRTDLHKLSAVDATSFAIMRRARRPVALDAKSLAAQDCVVLVTDHDAFDYELIARHAKLLVDTRGRYPKPQSHIVKA